MSGKVAVAVRGVMVVWPCVVGVALGCRPAAPELGTLYLFDCGGRIQWLDEATGETSDVRLVAEIDSTLPDAVRDGCAVHGGWYDDAADRLLLEVQTVPLQDSLDRLPTRLVALRDLEPTEGERGLGALALPAAPDRPAAAAALDSVEVPFDRGVGYLLDDGVTLLAQELTDSEASLPGVRIDGLWRAGEVGRRRIREDATGRYALVDLDTRVVRGSIVSAADEGEAEAAGVVCVTPGGRVYLAVAPDALLVLDPMRPGARWSVAVGLDLSWTACAWDGPAGG